MLFGAILLGPALTELSWQLALYALLSLTVVRMVPVVIAMWGSRARGPTLGFLGWFGPRGLASIVFAVIVVEESQLPHEHVIVLAIHLTVGLSVLAHGLTAPTGCSSGKPRLAGSLRMARPGLEPGTPRFSVVCSTN